MIEIDKTCPECSGTGEREGNRVGNVTPILPCPACTRPLSFLVIFDEEDFDSKDHLDKVIANFRDTSNKCDIDEVMIHQPAVKSMGQEEAVYRGLFVGTTIGGIRNMVSDGRYLYCISGMIVAAAQNVFSEILKGIDEDMPAMCCSGIEVRITKPDRRNTWILAPRSEADFPVEMYRTDDRVHLNVSTEELFKYFDVK